MEQAKKKFVVRNSVLTDVFGDNKTRNIYNVYLIVFMGLAIQTTVKQYVHQESVDFGFETIKTGFAKFDRALFIWFCCLGAACVSFFVFKVWSGVRNFDKSLPIIWDRFWAALLIAYYYNSFKLTTNAISYFEFNPPCAAFVSLESVRILMKVHSFVRENAPQVIYGTRSPPLNFSHFLYFLFAPTLIYRDNYPRTNNINWTFVGRRFLECLSVLFMYGFLLKIVYPSPERWAQKFSTAETVLLVAQHIPVGALVLMCTCFLVFHSWQNLFAEVTRFGDRLFYLDWWNSFNFNTFLTKWNKLVQDWLYYYIYRDFKLYVCDSIFLARIVVMATSFLVHEWVIYCWLGKLFPFMFLTVIITIYPAFYLKLPEHIASNVFLWCAISILTSALAVLSIFEYHAIKNAPLTDPSLWELLIPRFLTCECVFRD